MKDEVVCVWKIPKESIEDCPYHEKGIYPSGQLMGIAETVEQAQDFIHHLREGSPSRRFGEHEDPFKNDMEDAPYDFTISTREVMTE